MTRWNPEDLLVASASACHKLWYLHLCAVNHIHVLSYVDHALGFMEDADPVKRGHFTQITLRPEVVLEKVRTKSWLRNYMNKHIMNV